MRKALSNTRGQVSGMSFRINPTNPEEEDDKDNLSKQHTV